MKCDPSTACVSRNEVLRWAVVHDLIAHPFLALSGYARRAVRFHDWTSARAWPRPRKHLVLVAEYGLIRVWQDPMPGFFRVDHPTIKHSLVCKADNAQQALDKGREWFASLRREVGV